MEFRILGSLEIVGADGPIALGGVKRRGLLALLLVQRGTMVSSDRIVAELWGDEADRAVATVQTYVSQLRKLLGGAAGTALVTGPAGYALELDEAALDAARFERIAKGAVEEAGLERRVAQFDAALALWRGTPLDEFSWPWAIAERTRLERLRVETLCRRVDARLELGEHWEVLGELEALTSEYPLDERLWGRRMLAAYRSGRQADALRAFQQARRLLGEELGVEPGPELVELERRILEHDPSLDTQPRAPQPPEPAAPAQALPTGVVTFLLTDIVRSSELWEGFPHEMEHALPRHDAIIASAVTRAGGSLLKARGEGDSTFSVFARATDAVVAAIDLQEELQREAWPAPIDLHVRAAIHTGEAVERDGDFYGTTVNRAARIRAMATADEVLVSQSAAEVARLHLPSDVQLAELGIRQLPGSRHPERVHRLLVGTARDTAVVAVPADPFDAVPIGLPGFLSTDDAQFVGRATELAVLEDAWRRTCAGTGGRVVLVAGEPGVGKTSLVSRLAHRAYEDGGLVLAGRCDEGYDVPYQPFVEALGRLLHYPVAAAATRLDARLGGELVRILPDAAERLAGLPPPMDADPETARYRLFEAVAAWLGAVANEQPVVLVLDDLQWATAPTLLMLRHVARHPTRQLLVVATYRQTEIPAGAPFTELLAELHREQDFHRVELTGLSEADVAALVHTIAAPPGVQFPSPAEIHAQTGGNALFVRELLLNLIEQQAAIFDEVSGQPVWLTPRIRDIVIRRVSRLSPSCRETLEIAAIFGLQFALRALMAVDEIAPDGEQLLDRLDEAVASGLIVDLGGELDAFGFTHAVVRDAIERNLPTGRRLRLHLAAARALEKTTGDANLAQLSYHFSSALPLASVEEAISYARRAGDRAMSLLAFEEAVDHYARALDAIDHNNPDPTVDRCELLLALAAGHSGAGSVTAAADASEQAAEVARRLDLPEHFARAALCFEGELVSGAEFWAPRLAFLEEANTRLTTESELRVRVVAMLAHVRAGLEPGPEVEELSTYAVDMATRIGSQLALAAAVQARRQALAMPMHTDERAALARDVIAHGEAAGSSSWAMLGRHAHLSDLLELGELGAFETELAEYVDAAQQLQRPHDLWRGQVMLAGHALFSGRLAEGEQLAQHAYEVGVDLQQPGALQSYVIQQFHASWQRSQLGELLPSAISWADSRESTPGWRVALALAYAETGQFDHARQELDRVAAGDFAAVARDNLWLSTLSLAANACWLTGDSAKGAVLLELLAPFAARNVVIGTALALGSAGRAVGLLTALQGNADGAVLALEAALRQNQVMGSPLWEATARRDLADVLRMRAGPDDVTRAEREDAAVVDAARALGAMRLMKPTERVPTDHELL